MGRRAVVLIIALVLAAAAAFAIFQYLNNIREEIEAGEEQVPVFRATQPIGEGTEGAQILQGGDGLLYVSGFEQVNDLPEGAISTEEDLRAVLQGKLAVGPVPKNGILVTSQWVAPNIQIKPLKESIPAGKHAITISPGDVQGVNGFAQPGDLINVIVTLELEANLTAVDAEPSFGIPGGGEGTTEDGAPVEEVAVIPYTRFVLQNLPVLAVGRSVIPPESEDVSVSAEGEVGDEVAVEGEVQGEAAAVSTIYTLEVDPSQAERLVYAMQQGSIYLTLVPDDNQEVVTKGVTIDNLFEGDLLSDIFDNN